MKGNLPSKLKPLILDRYGRGMSGVDIAKELNCSTSIVSTYIYDFKAKEQAMKTKRQTCQNRQNAMDPEVRMLCSKHDTCETCDVGIKNPKLIRWSEVCKKKQILPIKQN